MKIECWSIGKTHDAALRDAIEDYTSRINRYVAVKWEIIAPPKHAAQMNEQEIRKQEGNLVLDKLDTDTVLVALDERGKLLGSMDLADYLINRGNRSTKRLVFLIGGAYGIDQVVLKKADLVWSLSKLTFPHQLVRLILAEQVYRAFTIIKNEKYHHS
jgi:23S rRNA (pseudouridine1915-N3)-methyltransferase